MDDEAVPVLVVATCHTPECPAEPCTCDMYGPPFHAVCAQCGKAVTDIVPVETGA